MIDVLLTAIHEHGLSMLRPEAIAGALVVAEEMGFVRVNEDACPPEPFVVLTDAGRKRICVEQGGKGE